MISADPKIVRAYVMLNLKSEASSRQSVTTISQKLELFDTFYFRLSDNSVACQNLQRNNDFQLKEL